MNTQGRIRPPAETANATVAGQPRTRCNLRWSNRSGSPAGCRSTGDLSVLSAVLFVQGPVSEAGHRQGDRSWLSSLSTIDYSEPMRRIRTMIFDQMIECWRRFQKYPVLRLAGVITAALGTLLWVVFPQMPPSPMDMSGLFIVVVTVSLVVWWSLGQAWRLRKAVLFFRSFRDAPEPKS
jgi:hypothetical protein